MPRGGRRMHVRMRMRKTRRCGRAPFPPAHPPPAPHARESPHGRHTARRHGESGGACNLARENTACPVSKNALRQRTIRTAQTTHTSGRRHTTHASELEKSVKVSCQQTADSRTGVTPELENPSRRRSIRFLQATTEHCGILLKLVMYVSRHVVRNPPPHPIPSHPIPSRSVRPLTPAAPPPAPRPPPPAVARSRRRPHNPRASPPPPAPRPPRRPASPRQRTAWRPPARSTARRAKPPPPPPPPPPADDGAAAAAAPDAASAAAAACAARRARACASSREEPAKAKACAAAFSCPWPARATPSACPGGRRA